MLLLLLRIWDINLLLYLGPLIIGAAVFLRGS